MHVSKKKRVVSFLIAFVMIAQIIPFDFTAFAASASTVARSENVVSIDGVNVISDLVLRQNADGSYTWQADLSSALSVNEISIDSRKVEDGYFVADKTGTYVIEHYGGDGADGQDTLFSEGGKGGYVYASIALSKGDVIYYDLGGTGEQTLVEDEGGGAGGGAGYCGGSGGAMTDLVRVAATNLRTSDAPQVPATITGSSTTLESAAKGNVTEDDLTKVFTVNCSGTPYIVDEFTVETLTVSISALTPAN